MFKYTGKWVIQDHHTPIPENPKVLVRQCLGYRCKDIKNFQIFQDAKDRNGPNICTDNQISSFQPLIFNDSTLMDSIN